MKFNVIVGNPPYQVSAAEGTNRTLPVYHHFVERAVDLDSRYVVMIVPSRWFTGGFGLDKFRERMIADRRLAKIVDYPDASDCFPSVEIKGGVNYFLWERDHDGDCAFTTRREGHADSTTTRDLRGGDGVLLRDSKAASILAKVQEKHGAGKWTESICGPQMGFGQMRTNYDDDRAKPRKGDIPMVFSSRVGYVPPSVIDKNEDWIPRWKVLIPKASDGASGKNLSVLGEPIALAPGSACTQTYIVAGMFDSRTETENYAYYLTSKFVRFLVLQRKTTQDIYADRFRFVPLLDMKRRWTDQDLYKKFGLTQDEIDYIEASIRPRSVNLSLNSPLPASHLPGGSKYKPKKAG